MARLELPIRAYVDDWMRRAFPTLDWTRTSAIRDLVLTPLAGFQQPFRHEIDLVKIGQSVTNWRYMRRADLDALAANWGKYRQTGGQSKGYVRCYFSRAADFDFGYLEFFTSDGVTFVLQGPVRVSMADLLANRQSDNTYYYDMPVISVGLGNRYSLAAGSIAGVRNAPPDIIRVENREDFQVTAPDEDNYDVVNAMYRNLGLRNLVSRASIRYPLYETFPGVLDIFIAGADHPKMVRDVVTVQIGGSDIDIHLGGMVDVWMNTTNLSQREVVFSYIPSSRLFRIVSDAQATAGELLYAFSRLLLSTEGEYQAGSFWATELDEGTTVYFDQAGIPVESAVIDVKRDDQYRLSGTDIITGADLISLPVPDNATVQEFVVSDVYGRNLHNVAVAVGQVLRIGSTYYRVLRISGKNLVLGQPETTIASLTFDAEGGANVVNAGDRYIPLTSPPVEVNDRMIATRETAQGHYQVLKVDSSGIYVGNILGQVKLVLQSGGAGPNNSTTWTVTAPDSSQAEIPWDVDGNCWIYTDSDGAYDQTLSKWLRITSVARAAGYLRITTNRRGPSTSYANATLVRGLQGAITDGMPLYFRRPRGSDFLRSVVQTFALGPTLFTNVLEDTLAVGTSSLTSAGLGSIASVGDLIIFDAPGTLTEEEILLSGGDGSKFSVFVADILSPDTVAFKPLLAAELSENLRYSVVRNSSAVNTATVSDIIGNLVTFNYWPLGLGDGLGMGIKANEEITGGSITAAAAAGTDATTLTLTPGTLYLERIRPGHRIEISGTSSGLDGTHTILHVIQSTETIVIDGTPGSGTWAPGTAVFTITADRIYTIQSSSAGLLRTLSFVPPQQAKTITMSATSYVSPSAADIGLAVRQTVGSVTYAGVLLSYDNLALTWTVQPNNPTVDLFVNWTGAGEEITVINSAASARPTGSPWSLFPVKYFSPIPSDVGKLVRQGTYTGILDSYDGSYNWQVKPLSEYDRFDSLADLTFVDRDGTGVPPVSSAQGYLRVPSTTPILNTGTVVMTLDGTPSFLTGAAVNILSRFGRQGGRIETSRFKVCEDGSISGDQFVDVIPGDHQLLVLNGSNFDLYEISKVTQFELTISGGAPAPEYVRIANAPAERVLPISATLEAGEVNITAPGSQIGLWGYKGRIFLLNVNGTVYPLTISAPNGEHSITLMTPGLPVRINPTQAVRYEIVEAFNIPFFIVAKATLENYRIFQPPKVGTVIFNGTTGQHSSSPGVNTLFTDPNVNFLSLIGYEDFEPTAQGLMLYVDEGEEASLTPYPIVGLSSSIALNVSHTFTTTQSALHYHISVENRAVELEQWFYATIINATTLELDSSFDFERYDTYRGWWVTVRPAPGLAPDQLVGPWEIPPMTASGFDPLTRRITLDVAAAHVPVATVADVFDTDTGASPRGFQNATLYRKVRVTVSKIRREACLTGSGSAVVNYNYYVGAHFVLPVVRIQRVDLLDPTTLQPVRQLDYRLVVDDPGLRYTHTETNRLEITDSDPDILFQPVRVTYVADASIASVDAYLNSDDTRVLGMSTRAKRTETVSVNLRVAVRSEKTEAALQSAVIAWINTLRSTERLTKDGLVRHLYANNLVTSVDTDSIRIDAEYHPLDGNVVTYTDVNEVFGSETAGYLSNIVTVVKET